MMTMKREMGCCLGERCDGHQTGILKYSIRQTVPKETLVTVCARSQLYLLTVNISASASFST
jgi:hypothetical protein